MDAEEKLRCIERRKVLSDWVDERVKITGVLEGVSTNRDPYKPFKVALVQDAEVELPGRLRHYLGHVWLQRAETLRDIRPGERFSCSCVVSRYLKRLPKDNGEEYEIPDYGLRFPNEVRVLTHPVALQTAHESNGHATEKENSVPTPSAPPPVVQPPPTPAPAAPPAVDPIALLVKVRDLMLKAGGLERVTQLQEAVAKVGGWEVVEEIQDLADDVGGWERMEQLLALLKL
jgi:hypothetical protein